MGLPRGARPGRRRRGDGLNALPLGWATDLEILRLGGSSIEEHADHLVVRTPGNPGYYWGNFVFMTERRDPQHCLDTFRGHFSRDQLAIGMLWEPDPRDWPGLKVETETVLQSSLPPSSPAVPGYEFRPLSGADWDQSLREATADGEPAFVEFVRRREQTRQRLAAAGKGIFLGAFHDGDLVSQLGIVNLGRMARYQSVITAAAHRGRGLASHLLELAGRWAIDAGAHELVMSARAAPTPSASTARWGSAPSDSPSRWKVTSDRSDAVAAV